MKKINSKQVFSGVALVGFLIVALFYVLIFMKYEEMTTAVKQENAALKSKVTTLKAYHQNSAQYKAEIESMQTGIEQILNEYPANAMEEDAIMLAVDMEGAGDISYKVINMGEDTLLYSIPEEKVKAAKLQGLQNTLDIVEKRVTYNNEISYKALKECIGEIYENDNRIAISNIVYIKDENGKLVGNIDVSFYSVRGTDKEYVKPDIAKYAAGKADLFQ